MGPTSTASFVGYAMTLAACMYKFPVIRNILRARSTAGLNPVATYLETSGHLAYAAYNYFRGNPLSSYGDVMTTSLQELVIISFVLCWGNTETITTTTSTATNTKEEKENDDKLVGKDAKQSERETREQKVVSKPMSALHIATLFVCVCVFLPLLYLGATTSPYTQSYVISYAIAMKTCSKLPQIYTNFVKKSQGVQSLWTATSACLGPLVKLYIAMVQVKDPLLIGGAILTFSLNLVVFLQIVSFRFAGEKNKAKGD